MRAILDIINVILDLYVWLLIASAILSWLIAFNVVNTRNQFVASVAEFLYKITEPVLRPIRTSCRISAVSISRPSSSS
jgi:YggT family protein